MAGHDPFVCKIEVLPSLEALLLVGVLRFELKAVPPQRGVTAFGRLFLLQEALSSRYAEQKNIPTPKRKDIFGPSVEIRTQGLLNPIQARYQTSPHPDIHLPVRQLIYNSTLFSILQPLIFDFFIFVKYTFFIDAPLCFW